MTSNNSSTKVDPRLVGLGLIAGAAVSIAGIAYVGTKRRQFAREGVPPLIDWERVRSVARQITQEEPAVEGWHKTWEEYYARMVDRCYPIITAEMGRDLPSPVDHIEAFTRTEWIDANIANFRELFDHVEALYKRVQTSNGFGTAIMSGLSQLMLSSQLGVLMGYLARRVLGQYDLALLGKEPVSAGKLYFVEPNISGVQTELNLDPDDFRLWIALHETTHAYEFEAYPWVREYFNSLLEDYIGSLGDDILQYGTSLGGLRAMIERARHNRKDGDSWIEVMMSKEQHVIFNKLQAVMSIVEGYSNYIMNSVGERLLPSYATIKERIEERAARRTPAEKLFIRLTGLALKMEQYRLGESFINGIVAERGVATANRIWEGPQMLPTLEELREPKLWLQRLEG